LQEDFGLAICKLKQKNFKSQYTKRREQKFIHNLKEKIRIKHQKPTLKRLYTFLTFQLIPLDVLKDITKRFKNFNHRKR
jgi:hypothetical protein